MSRDIDYAAIAVEAAIVEKFGKRNDLQELRVDANDRAISIRHTGRAVEGTRDDLLAAVRKADTYDELWEALARRGK